MSTGTPPTSSADPHEDLPTTFLGVGRHVGKNLITFRWWLVLATLGATLLVLLIGWAIIGAHWLGHSRPLLPVPHSAYEEASRFGDSFGFADTLLSGLAFLGIVITLILQQRQMQEQQSEQANREALMLVDTFLETNNALAKASYNEMETIYRGWEVDGEGAYREKAKEYGIIHRVPYMRAKALYFRCMLVLNVGSRTLLTEATLETGLGVLRQIDVAAQGSRLWFHEKIDAAYRLFVDAKQILKWRGDSGAAKSVVGKAEAVVVDVLAHLQEDQLSREMREWDTDTRVVRRDMEKVSSTIQQIKEDEDGDKSGKRLDLCVEACAEAMWDLSRILTVV